MPAIIAAACAVLFVSAVSYYVYRRAFYNKNDRDVTYDVPEGDGFDRFRGEMTALIDGAAAIPFEEVRTVSFDGLSLYGRIYFRSPGAPFHIQFNGYKGNGIRDFSGGLQLALASGGNVLLTDQRAHGRSEGHTITFGVKERRDVLSWVRFITDRYGGDVKIYLEGVSMGAATVLMASDLPLPQNVRGIIADCPYSSPFAVTAAVADRIVRVKYVTYPFIILGALLFGRFRILSSSAVRSVKNSRVPILIIHGTGDRFVPVEMSRKIRGAAPDRVTLVEVEGAPHGLSYLKDYGAYKKEFLAFLNKTL